MDCRCFQSKPLKFLLSMVINQYQQTINTLVRRWFSLFSVIALLAMLMLTGCVHIQSESQQNSVSIHKDKQTTLTPQELSLKVKQQASHIDSSTMFEILAAEMMVQRGQVLPAFDILYPLAEETQNKELAERVFKISMATYNVENIEKATLLWRKISPEKATAWRASFLLSLRHNNVDSALKEWDTYRSLSDQTLDQDFIVSATKVAASVPHNPGISFFQALTESHPEKWSAFYALGIVSSVYKDARVGIQALNTSKKLMPESQKESSLPLIYNLLAKLYLISGDSEQGVEALAPYANSHMTDLLLQERMARLEVQAQRYGAAEQRYLYIIEAEPKAYASILSLALLQLEREAYDQAEKNLLTVVSNKAYQHVGHYYLGVLNQERGRPELAINYFSKVESDNYYVDAQLHLAEIYFAADNTAKAFNILNAITQKGPKEAVKVLRAKAIFSSAEKQFDEAVAFYHEALQLEPNNSEMLKAQSAIFYKQDRFDEYESNLLRALKVNSNDVDSLNALGYFYVEKGTKLDQANVLLQKALSLASNSYYILDSVGWYYYHVKDYGQAIHFLNKAFKIDKDEEVFIHLISAYWQNKETNRAKSLWKKYRKNFLQSDRVQNLINELESQGRK